VTFAGRHPSPGFTFHGRIRSVRFALRGLALMLRSQHNAWVHAVATVAVLALGLLLGVTAAGWCGLVLAMMAVWTAEALNTALELLADVASPEFHPLVAQAKDVAAGAVLLSALGSVVIGLLILGPPLLAVVAGAW
jgi:diacylglycerol kinase (ATP)